ncbi:MAG: Druantia anti-phage system protein DruA [Limisphaerales bacterium]
MAKNLIVQGRRLDELDLQSIRQWLEEKPDWSRWRLSRELATRWDWRNGAGQLKDMAVRTLLGKLEQRGLIRLPPRRQVPTNRMRCCGQRGAEMEWDQRRIDCNLAQLDGLTVKEISTQPPARAWGRAALGRFHYLDFGGAVGENLQYVVRDGAERPLACLVFGAAAWKCHDRDRFIGWSDEQRQKNLAWVANNTRFLILPWVRVPHLASWILGQISRRIRRDWQGKYGHPLVALETFVEQERFVGTAYRAANWWKVGQTKGRTRQDRHTCIQAPVKDIYLYPLRRNFREALQA